ncbi:DUF948 domain-containing protein [Lederbergia sp. NSJ-179]|uniref:DUF948 domain-containing protein n=1 Tax=Lederbergia sp. NSJ-179 TaxID=2931402 RepID=UPI001FD10594|nr:DUF948 domain-containing protein [Lederbergia sp. NSJ-179]MCJ7842362.1 DUF948 domain-containing protein [Lederbergia sp. NSJ-179]
MAKFRRRRSLYLTKVGYSELNMGGVGHVIIILYVSVAVIAIAFVFLVVRMMKTLNTMTETMSSVSQTLDSLQKQLEGVTGETTMLLHKTNALAEDIQRKVERLDTVVNAVQEVGGTVQELNHSLKKVTLSISTSMNKNQEKIAQMVQWGAAIKEIKDKWFGERNKHAFSRKQRSSTQKAIAAPEWEKGQ